VLWLCERGGVGQSLADISHVEVGKLLDDLCRSQVIGNDGVASSGRRTPPIDIPDDTDEAMRDLVQAREDAVAMGIQEKPDSEDVKRFEQQISAGQ
jgi:hypothetical protein